MCRFQEHEFYLALYLLVHVKIAMRMLGSDYLIAVCCMQQRLHSYNVSTTCLYYSKLYTHCVHYLLLSLQPAAIAEGASRAVGGGYYD
jgi:hypothetical protein